MTDKQWIDFLMRWVVEDRQFPNAPQDEISFTKSDLLDFIVKNDLIK